MKKKILKKYFDILRMIKNDKKWYVKNPPKYSCLKCNYFTCSKKDFEKHCETKKHKVGQNDKKKSQKSPHDKIEKEKKIFKCDICNRVYKFQSGYSRHKIRCKGIERNNYEEAMKSQHEEMMAILKETNDVNNKLCEKILTLEAQNNIINTTINNNQKLNINVFLNNECKDAMNMSEFIDQIKLTCDDLMYTKNNGYIKGITNIFVKNLEEIEMKSRPIHCSDSKKQQFFIKNENKWEEDKEHQKLDKTIDSVAQKQISQIKEWEKGNPNWSNTEEGTQEYMQIIQSIMGGKDDNEREKNNKNIKINLTDPLLVDNDINGLITN